jgi:MarR family transcriptional regulator, lower aerobic nicotinate degradation pathway regulator
MDDVIKILLLLREYDDVKKQYQKSLKRSGWHVTGPQVAVLRILGRAPGQSVSELADTMGIHVTTAQGYATRLASQGLIITDKDPADKRRKLLWLTTAGEQIIRDVPLGYKSLLLHNLPGVSAADRQLVLTGLTKLLELMKEGDH